MIRLAAIGSGNIARRQHFPELLQLGKRARLVAVAGRNETRLAECARQFNVPKYYLNVDDMLASEEIDAVLVLTPPSAHAKMAIKAVAAGKHVLIEKPMVKTMDEAGGILAAVERSGVVFFPLPHVASPGYDTVRELLVSGVVGEVTNVECHKSHRGPSHADWFYQKEVAGGGVLFDLGIYALGGIAKVFGPARRVTALCGTRFDVRTMDDGSVVHPDVEDSALLTLWLENQVAVTVNANWNGYVSHHVTRSRITVFGREGMLHFDTLDGSIHVHRADDRYDMPTGKGEPVDFDGYRCRRIVPRPEGGSPTIVEHFMGLIEAGDTSLLPLRQQMHVMEIMLAAYECGELGGAREIETSF